MFEKTIVVGDVHGCLEELDELLRKCEYRRGDRVVLVGDLVDRGPDPVGVVRRARELGLQAVLGNHEEKHLRYRKHEMRKEVKSDYKNPRRPFPAGRLAEHNALSAGDWGYLEKLPLYLEIPGWIYVVHAGLEPDLKIEEQDPSVLLRCLYLRRDTRKMVSLDEMEKAEPGNLVAWPELWYGTHNVIHGHHVTKVGPSMVMSKHRDYDEVTVWGLGIDTGCCFGGALTAAIVIASAGGLDSLHLVSVSAKQTYFQGRGDA